MDVLRQSSKSSDQLVFFGLEDDASSLVQRYRQKGWQVAIAVRRPPRRDEVQLEPDGLFLYLPDLGETSLRDTGIDRAEVLVVMSGSDEDNLHVCRCATERLCMDRVIVRVNDMVNLTRFCGLSVTIVAPFVGIFDLLDHLAHKPISKFGLLKPLGTVDTINLEVRDPALDLTPIRRLHVPDDVLFLSMRRGFETVSPRPNTELRLGDWVTVLGSKESVEEVRLLFEVEFPEQRTRPVWPITSEWRVARAVRQDRPFVFSEYPDANLMRARVHVQSKAELFEIMAEIFALPFGLDSKEAETAFWAREEQQDTYVGDGLAIPHAMLDGLDHTRFGVITLADPLDFGSGNDTDVVFCMLSPPVERTIYLKLLAVLAQLCEAHDLLNKLRSTSSAEELEAVFVTLEGVVSL